MFNFKTTEAAKGVTFLAPGVYAMTPTKVELGTFPKGTKYLGVTFETEEGTSYTEKFILSEKAISRLQYLHVAFFGKPCEKEFGSEEEVEKYFRKALTTKKIVKNIIVGGETSGNATYANLPYTDFVDTDEAFDLGEFEVDSEEWKKYVKKRTATTSSDLGSQGVLNDSTDSTPIGTKAGVKGKKEKEVVAAGEDGDDMPW